MATEIIRDLKIKIVILIATIFLLTWIICGLNVYYVEKIEDVKKQYIIKQLDSEYTVPDKVIPESIIQRKKRKK